MSDCLWVSGVGISGYSGLPACSVAFHGLYTTRTLLKCQASSLEQFQGIGSGMAAVALQEASPQALRAPGTDFESGGAGRV